VCTYNGLRNGVLQKYNGYRIYNEKMSAQKKQEAQIRIDRKK
jgi:hypothetical protein